MSTPIDITADFNAQVEEQDQLLKGLSWRQRMEGFLIFFSLGAFATVLSYIALYTGRYWKYTVLSTLGSIMSLCSTTIVMGPEAQKRYMFDEYRRTASCLYLVSLFLTLIFAFVFKSVFICLLCGIFQYGCLIWYSLSYVPYGRETVLLLLSRN
ncbi:hypothetical protein STCU_00506 [Strigomonas culicis]|uniref:Vesicle transport protein n=1 Tax=Strigomonas culicis TaxID=28005 RepID=S9V715_9TRYP|nr:hypothetical protein STCU_04437 [Strigomonas culicis]EPY36588.1 hypothetical protein STCU_00506 [Strigomonas culicis]|eukprot:EPY29584.1 hypothetical protein STCU_04437 [Strigomonas culicis]